LSATGRPGTCRCSANDRWPVTAGRLRRDFARI
jgi:hypothetical protein